MHKTILLSAGIFLLLSVLSGCLSSQPSSLQPPKYVDSTRCSSFSGVVCQGFAVDSSGTLRIVLNNKAGLTIRDPKIISGAGAPCIPSVVSPNSNFTCTSANYLPSGKTGDTFGDTPVQLEYFFGNYSESRIDRGLIAGTIR